MVQVPRLQKIETSIPQPQGKRINIKAQDNASSILNRTSGLASLAQDAVNLNRDIEDNKISTMANDSEKEFRDWKLGKTQALNSITGDPTEAYVQYDKEVKEKYESMIAAKPDLNDRVKRGFTGNLNKMFDDSNYESMKKRGAQVETYKHNSAESAIKTKRESMSVNAGYIEVGKADSYAKFDESINDLKTSISQRALETHSATRVEDPKGAYTHSFIDADNKQVRVKMNDVSKQRAAQEISKGISESLTNMINSGYMKEAQQTFDKYKLNIGVKERAKLNKKFKTQGLKDSANDNVRKIESSPVAKRDGIIRGIKDPEEKRLTLRHLDENSRYRANLKKKESDTNYEYLSASADALIESGGVKGYNDLQNKQSYKATWDKLNTKARQAIKEKFDAPTKTSQKSLNKVVNLFTGGDIDKLGEMTFDEYNQEYLLGLSQSDKNKFTSRYLKYKDPSASQQRSAMTFAGKQIKNQLLVSGVITKDERGKLTSEEQNTITKVEDAYFEYVESMGRELTPEETRKVSKQLSANVIRESKWFGKDTVTVKPLEKPKRRDRVSSTGSTREQRKEARINYRKQHGSLPNRQQLEQFMKGN